MKSFSPLPECTELLPIPLSVDPRNPHGDANLPSARVYEQWRLCNAHLPAHLYISPEHPSMPVNFTGSYTQNFDTLANTGGSSITWTNQVTLPGWSLFRQATPATAITTYGVDDGASTSGNFLSYGTTGTIDRALGGLGTGGSYFGSPAGGATAGWIAFATTNTTGATINSLNVAFNGEQWRNGGNTTAQSMVLQYGFGTSFGSVSTWTTPGGNFNWTSPVATATAAAVFGNVAGLVANRGGTLNSLNWTNGSTLWFRWVETNDVGNDHALAIDDFSLSVPTPQTFTVINTNDSGAGSLRQAILDANADPTTADTIVFGGVFTDSDLTNDTITLTSGELSIAGNVTIDSGGGNPVTLSGNNASSVFQINSGSVVALNALTLINGRSIGDGGIFNAGTLSINNSTFSGNSGSMGAGGIYNYGTLSINNSTFSGNEGTAGAIFNDGSGTLSINNSTFSGNTGSRGAIFNGGIITNLSSSTFGGNTAISGGAGSVFNNTFGNINTLRNNLFVENSDNTIPTATDASNNLSGTFASLGVDPNLKNNGGSTQTHALLAGSSAINAGSNAAIPADTLDQDGDGNTTEPIPFDQRGTGFARVIGGTVDVGAFETQISQPDLSPGISTPGPLAVGIPFNYTLDVQNNDTANASGVTLTFTLPANVTYNSSNVLSGGFGTPTLSGSTLTFTGGSVNAGSFAQIQVNVTPTQAGTLGGTTLVADPNNTITESNEANNSVTTPTFTVNPAPGVTIAQSGGNTAVTEGGTTDIYTVVLDSPPTQNVTITLNNSAQTTTNAATLIFTPGNWNTAQTVTVTAVDDATIEGSHTGTITHTVSSADSRYNGMTIAAVTATITDNDAPIVNLSVSNSAGSEAGTTVITVTAIASAAVSGNQTVTLGVSGTGITTSDYYLSNSTLTIPNGQTTGSVSFIVADDAIPEGTETAVLTLSNPSAGISVGTTTSQNITITNNNDSFLTKVGGATSINGAEIPAFDPSSDRLFVVAGNTVEIYTISNTGSLAAAGSLPAGITPPGGTELIPNSVAVKNGIVAVAYAVRETTTGVQQPGRVGFYNAATGTFINSVTVGALPDMLTFTPNGTKVLVANEGEPNSYNQGNSFDPEGSISIIDIAGGVASATVQTATFTAFNSQLTALRAAGVRIIGPNATVAQDLEPEYIAVSADGLTARITLQENNAIAILDIASATITNILPLGAKNHNLSGNGLDASDRDEPVTGGGRINIQNWPVFGLYQPDAIASYTVNGQTYYITANEGDARDYSGFAEEIRVGVAGYVLDPNVFPNGTTLKQNANLGRLTVTTATGDTAGDGDFDRIEAFGARSFSIWDSNGNQVFDSGNQLEQITATRVPTVFNSDGTAATFDARSDNKGPEPEGVVIGEISGRIYAFIGLERVGDVMVYDVTDPTQPQLIQHINTPEDVAVEGLTFVAAADSPTGKPLLITASEVSRTVAVFEVALTAGVTIAQSGGNTAVTEGGTTDIYTVVLDSPPTQNVTITLNNSAQTTTNAATLIFTPGNWNTAQTVTVTAVDDATIEGSHTGTITHTVSSADSRYNGMTIAAVTATITDNDAPIVNLSVSNSAGSEAGTTAVTVTATASSAVQGNQTVTLGVSGSGITAGDYSLSNTAITIPDGQTFGTVTFTVVDDAVLESTETATLTISNPSAGITLGSTTTQNVVITDNDETAGISVVAGTPVDNNGSLLQAGDLLYFPFTITNTGNDPTRFQLPTQAGITGPGTIGTLQLSYDNGTTWADIPGSGLTTNLIDVNGTINVRVPVTVNAGATPGQTIKVTLGETTPAETAANSPRAGSINDARDIYTVDNPDGIPGEAAGLPNNGVVEGSAAATATISPKHYTLANIFLTRDAYSNSGTPTDITDDTIAYRMQLQVRSTDVTGQGITPAALAGTIVAGLAGTHILVASTIPSGTDLAAAPTAPSGWQVVYSTASTSTPANAASWTTTAPPLSFVTRIGFVKPTTDGDSSTYVAANDALTEFTFQLRVESGQSAPLTIANLAQVFGKTPESNAPVFDESGDQNPSNFDGTPGNMTPPVNTDTTGDGVPDQLPPTVGDGYINDSADLTATGTDTAGNNTGDTNNPGANNAGEANVFTIAALPTVNLSVSANSGTEAGTTTITVTATASAAVAGDQTVTLGVSGTGITAGDYSLSNSTITIPDGQTSGTITFTVANDSIAEASETATLTISSPSAGITLGSTTTQAIAITDNDTAGVTITQSGGNTTITEGGATDTYTVVLNSQPTADVTLNISNGSQTSTSPTTLTFTDTNWNVARTVTVTAIDDLLNEGSHTGTITHTVSSADSRYNGMTIAAVTATITDNDNPPTDISLTNTAIDENEPANSLVGNFNSIDPDGGGFSYTLVGGTGDTHNDDFTIGGNHLRLKPMPDYETRSSYSIRVRTTDFSGLTYDKPFTITVNDRNDAPIILDTDVTLSPSDRNAGAPVGAVGTPISRIVNLTGGSGQNNIVDPDAGSVPGIAITTANISNGTWFYSTDNGANWSNLGSVSESSSRLLAANPNTRLYFQPNTGYTGTIADAITFRAWDQTSGTNGALTSTVSTGNPTAFSTATDTASISVRRDQKVDVNSDRQTDLFWWNELSGAISFWAMNGATLAYSRLIATIPISSGWVPVGMGDFTNDGKTDILWRNQQTGQNGFWEMTGETSFQPYLIESEAVNSGWDVVGVGDFTNDGLADIVWRNSITGQNRFWEMNGTTRVAVVDMQAEAQPGWDIMGVTDFTGDGHTDILWRNRLSGENRYWEMNGANFVQTHAIESVPVSSGWQVAAVGDFNRDTEVDILWRNSNNGIAAFWLTNGTPKPDAQLLLPTWEPASGWTIV